MTSNSFKTIAEASTGYFKDRQSKFYAYAYPVESEEDIKTLQKQLRKKHYDARHHVYAFILGNQSENFRYSDDGEPANSSAPPIYNSLKSHELTNILVVVVRYFGGKKLGIPGLINAYQSATEDAISNAKIITKTIDVKLEINFSYSLTNKVMYIINKINAKIQNQDFSSDCSMTISIRKNKSEELIDMLKKNGVKII